jgi:cell division protein FtsL
MLAAERVPLQTKPRVNVRTAKQATQKRRAHTVRSRYAAIWRFSAILVGTLAVVMLYVMGTARLTSLNYAVARAEHERAQLQSETLRLDDQLARLRSEQRLAAVAAKLQMKDPQQFALVKLPVHHAKPDGSHVAFLSTITGWFGAK